jgi:hypothetical protein
MRKKVCHEIEMQRGIKVSVNDAFYIIHGRCVDRACILAIYVFPEPVVVGFNYFIVHEALLSLLMPFLFYPFVIFKCLFKGNPCKKKQKNYQTNDGDVIRFGYNCPDIFHR